MEVGDGIAWLCNPVVGAFQVENGRRIIIEAAAGVDPVLLEWHLLGPAMAVLLRQRGYLVLHASGVVVCGTAVLFAGDCGMGKSTIAAALHRQRRRLLCDDIAAIDMATSPPMVWPGFPLLKLDDRSVAATRAQLTQRSQSAASHSKYNIQLNEGFNTDPVPLSQIFVLSEGETQAVEPLRPREAMLELLRHTYGARGLQTMRRAQHFERCVTLASTLRVARLHRPKDIEALPSLVEIVHDAIPPAHDAA